MKKNEWTERRLQRLFGHYNRRFWRKRLPIVHIRICELDGNQGEFDRKKREIRIDMRSYASDRQIRATLLHEMAHLASRKAGHGAEFWYQIELLLRQKALITVDSPETPGLIVLENVVPPRFPLARRMMNNAEKKRQREVLKSARYSGLQIQKIGEQDILNSFEEAAQENPTWRQALLVVGREYGLIDVDCKPTDRWAADLIAKGRRAYVRARRDHLSYEKRVREFEAAGVLAPRPTPTVSE
jgi:hypothetical protein